MEFLAILIDKKIGDYEHRGLLLAYIWLKVIIDQG